MNKRREIERVENPIGISLDAFAEDHFTEKQYDPSSEHPIPEQLMIRQAVQYLTPKQKKVWELWNYDKLTQDDIAKKLGMTQQGVMGHIKRIEARIAKWVESNLGAYKLLKTDFEKQV